MEALGDNRCVKRVQILGNGRRNSLGLLNLVKELTVNDAMSYKDMKRMRKQQFTTTTIFGLVETLILKERTNF